MNSKSKIKRGRPKGEIQSRNLEVKAFFTLCDKLNLSLIEVVSALSGKLQNPPHYRTLQEWRRGKHEPKFAPFITWSDIIRQYAKTHKQA